MLRRLLSLRVFLQVTTHTSDKLTLTESTALNAGNFKASSAVDERAYVSNRPYA